MRIRTLATLPYETWLLAADLIEPIALSLICRARGHATPLTPHRMAARTIHYCPRCQTVLA